jgi:precorrin-6B methylase 2
VEIVAGEAPEALKGLPPPHRVFIGGSGGKLKDIVDFIGEKMPCEVVVINAATLETLNEAILYLENHSFEVEVSEISVSRSKVIGKKKHLSALNPVFVVVGKKMRNCIDNKS